MYLEDSHFVDCYNKLNYTVKINDVKGEYLMEEFMEKELTVKVSEMFVSLQGEGLRASKPSLFVRLFGCNLNCPGFGLPKGEKNTEIPAIIKKIDQYKSYKDLPLSKTGCDSYPSSNSHFKRFSPEYTFPQLYDKMMELVNNDSTDIDLVMTGGEPLLKPQQKKFAIFIKQYHEFINKFSSLTFETNGTQKITDELNEAFQKYLNIPVIFSISPKLECSGEPRSKTIIPVAIESIKKCVDDYNHKFEYNTPLRFESTYYFKYVVTNEDDVKEALEVTNILDPAWREGNKFVDRVYLMPCGGTFEEHNMNAKNVAELAIKYRLRFSYRVHCMIWKNSWSK